MNCEKAPTGKPSEDRRWMQYYPEMMLKMIQKPECTLWEYLEQQHRYLEQPITDPMAVMELPQMEQQLTEQLQTQLPITQHPHLLPMR